MTPEYKVSYNKHNKSIRYYHDRSQVIKASIVFSTGAWATNIGIVISGYTLRCDWPRVKTHQVSPLNRQRLLALIVIDVNLGLILSNCRQEIANIRHFAQTRTICKNVQKLSGIFVSTRMRKTVLILNFLTGRFSYHIEIINMRVYHDLR